MLHMADVAHGSRASTDRLQSETANASIERLGRAVLWQGSVSGRASASEIESLLTGQQQNASEES